jgi:hypothetical protein
MSVIRNLTNNDIELDDLNGITIRALSDYDLLHEFDEDILNSIELLAAIDAGYIVFLTIDGDPLTGTESVNVQRNVTHQPAPFSSNGVVHVDSSNGSDISGDGGIHKPFKTIGSGYLAAVDGDTISIARGTYTESVALSIAKGVNFQGAGDDSTIVQAGATFAAGKDIDAFHQDSAGCYKTFKWDGLTIRNSRHGVYLETCLTAYFNLCTFTNNGWSGNRLSTRLGQTGTWAASGTLGYDSSMADLQSFAASSEVTDGGAIKIGFSYYTSFASCALNKNFRGLELINAQQAFVTRSQLYDNIMEGLLLDSSTGDANAGCNSVIAYNNYIAYNSCDGIRNIGGITNTLALNEIMGNWNAGVSTEHGSNITIRDTKFTDNNLSTLCGNGQDKTQSASMKISGGTINPLAHFICEVIDTQIYNSGDENISNSERMGLMVSADVSDNGNRTSSIVTIDDVGFQNQDYALDILCDLDVVRLSLGDCRYIDTKVQNVRVAQGAYYELPFSNHHTNAQTLDFSIDDTGSTISIRENPSGSVINNYAINTLRAEPFGTNVRILLSDSSKVQFDDVPVGGVTIDGVQVNSVLGTAVDDLNGEFTQTLGFVGDSGPYPTSGSVSGTTLTLSLSDASQIDIDVTSLTVQSDNHVVSGSVSGTTLNLNMDDLTIVPIDISLMNNGCGCATSGATFAPDISDQSFSVIENSTINWSPVLDNNSDAVTMYAFEEMPEWLMGDQLAGTVLGVAPAFSGLPGSGVPDQHTFKIKTGNPFGVKCATATVNVTEDTSTSTVFTHAVCLHDYSDRLEHHSSSFSKNPMLRDSNGDGRAWTATAMFRYAAEEGTIWAQSKSKESDGYSSLRIDSVGDICLMYGNGTDEYIKEKIQPSMSVGDWMSVTVSFDGGTTGSSSGSISSYHSRFKMYTTNLSSKVSTEETTVDTDAGSGWDGKVEGKFKIGARYNEDHLEFCAAYVGLTNSALPSGSISEFSTDPLAWISNNSVTDPDMNKVWIMGSGPSDVYPKIMNQVDDTDSDSRVDMNSMVPLDIINVTIPGL